MIDQNNFFLKPYPVELERRGLTNSGHVFPLATDGPMYHKIVVSYVNEYVDIYFKNQQDMDDGKKKRRKGLKRNKKKEEEENKKRGELS